MILDTFFWLNNYLNADILHPIFSKISLVVVACEIAK